MVIQPGDKVWLQVGLNGARPHDQEEARANVDAMKTLLATLGIQVLGWSSSTLVPGVQVAFAVRGTP